MTRRTATEQWAALAEERAALAEERARFEEQAEAALARLDEMIEMRTNTVMEAIKVLAAACPQGFVLHPRPDLTRLPGEALH